jgi:benzoyl-CoA reductase/2-hydroxyglutaryl-CoA dehydratase subunit BcrC/BadD/HgdB
MEAMVDRLPVIPRRSEVIHAHKEQGGLIAAVTPIHYPRALLRAFNILPIEVWGPPRVDTSYGAAHLQPYVCSIVRNILSFLNMGGLDVTDMILVPHACDSLQGLGSILLDFARPRQPVMPMYLPRAGRNQASALQFLADEFRALTRQLQAMTRRSPSNAELMDCIRREETADALLAQLYQRRAHLPFSDFEFYRLVRSREYLPAETYTELAGVALAQAVETRRDGVPLLLSGIVPEPMNLFDTIAEIGGLVVADDLACCGRRLYPPGTSDDAFCHLAESILGGPPDSTRGHPIHERCEHLLRLVKTSGAKGVVFYDVKFCEPELFDLPNLGRGLQEAGIPFTTIEVDIGDPLSHQTITRLEALVEMIA